MCVASCDAKFIVGSLIDQTDKFNTGVGVKIYEIAISRSPRYPAEYSDTSIVAVSHSIDLLVKDSPPSKRQRAALDHGFQRAGNPLSSR
jgi:hypothetical protein